MVNRNKSLSEKIPQFTKLNLEAFISYFTYSMTFVMPVMEVIKITYMVGWSFVTIKKPYVNKLSKYF